MTKLLRLIQDQTAAVRISSAMADSPGSLSRGGSSARVRALADRITRTIAELVEASERETGQSSQAPTTAESLLERLQSVASTLGIRAEPAAASPPATPDTKAQTRQLRSGVMDRQYRPAPAVVHACEDESLHTAGGAVFSMRRAWVLKVARGEKPPQVNPALWVAYRMFVDEHLLVGKTTTTGFHTYAVSRALAVAQNPLGFSGTCAVA